MPVDAGSNAGLFENSEQTAITIREPAGRCLHPRVFFVVDRAEFLLAAFEAEGKRVIEKPPGFKRSGHHVHLDLSHLDSPEDLELCILQALINERQPTPSFQDKDVYKFQSACWRHWLDKLLSPELRSAVLSAGSSQEKPSETPNQETAESARQSGANETEQDALKFLSAGKSTARLNPIISQLRALLKAFIPLSETSQGGAGKQAQSNSSTAGNDSSQEQQKEREALLERINKLKINFSKGRQNVDMIAQGNHGTSADGGRTAPSTQMQDNDIVLLISGLEGLPERVIRALLTQLPRVCEALKLRGIVIIQRQRDELFENLRLVTYPDAHLRLPLSWLYGTPLFVLPTNNLEWNDQIRRLEIKTGTDSKAHPLTEAMFSDIDAVKIPFIASDGSLRTLLRIARRAIAMSDNLSAFQQN